MWGIDDKYFADRVTSLTSMTKSTKILIIQVTCGIMVNTLDNSEHNKMIHITSPDFSIILCFLLKRGKKNLLNLQYLS